MVLIPHELVDRLERIGSKDLHYRFQVQEIFVEENRECLNLNEVSTSLDHGRDLERQTLRSCFGDERQDVIEVKSRLEIEVARSLLLLQLELQLLRHPG